MSTDRLRASLRAAALAAALAACASGPLAPGPSGHATAESTVPTEALTDLEGQPHQLRDFEGEVVLLDFYFDFYRDKLHQEMVVDRGHLLANEAESATEKSLSGDGDKTISIDEAMKAIEDK